MSLKSSKGAWEKLKGQDIRGVEEIKGKEEII